MTETGTNETTWPLPKFYFAVEIGSRPSVQFQEVSGLDTESQIVEYRHGDSTVFSTIKMPGIQKYGNVTMKKGIFKNENSFWDWYNEIKMNVAIRETVTIALLDETGKPAMTWTLGNAWPTKITGTDLKSSGNEVAIETIEMAYEVMSIKNA